MRDAIRDLRLEVPASEPVKRGAAPVDVLLEVFDDVAFWIATNDDGLLKRLAAIRLTASGYAPK